MARHPISADTSDDEAPEAFSLSQSKKNAKEKLREVKNFEASQKVKKKTQNRERDRKLKERALVARFVEGKKPSATTNVDASESERGSDDEGLGEDEVVARMERAMREAREEMGEDEDGDDIEDDDSIDIWTSFGGGDPGSDGFDNSQGDEDESMSDGEAGDDNEEEDEMMPTKNKSNPNYLEENLFTSAFSSQSKHQKMVWSSQKSTKHTSKTQNKDALKKRRRKHHPGAKDLVMGSRTIRTLAKASDPTSMPTTKTLPPSTVNKFLNRSLNLKGKANSAKTKGWERRPANIGVFKNVGAPARFVRNPA